MSSSMAPNDKVRFIESSMEETCCGGCVKSVPYSQEPTEPSWLKELAGSRTSDVLSPPSSWEPMR